MNLAVDIILPVFGLVALGYVAGKAGWISQAGIEGLSTFVFNFAIPVLLFRSIAIAELPAAMPWAFLLAYYGTTLALFGVTMLAGRLFSLAGAEPAIFGMSASYSNVVLLGIPIILGALGEAARVPLFIIISTHAAVMFVVTTLLAELGSGQRERLAELPRQTIMTLARNMIVVGLVLGLIVNLAGLSLPATVDSMASYLGEAALPCAVFSMGASISQYRIRGDIARIGTVVVLKNVAHPLLVWIACALIFRLPDTWTAVLVILAACPSGINAYLFANRYRAIVPSTAAAVVVSTAISIPVVSALLIWLAG